MHSKAPHGLGAGSCAIDFQTESVLSLNKNFQLTFSFLFSAKSLLVWKSIAHDLTTTSIFKLFLMNYFETHQGLNFWSETFRTNLYKYNFVICSDLDK